MTDQVTLFSQGFARVGQIKEAAPYLTRVPPASADTAEAMGFAETRPMPLRYRPPSLFGPVGGVILALAAMGWMMVHFASAPPERDPPPAKPEVHSQLPPPPAQTAAAAPPVQVSIRLGSFGVEE